MGAAHGRMACERQLLLRRKNAQVIVGLLGRRREHKGCFRQVGPGRDPLHLFRRQSFRPDNDRHGVSQERLLREDIDLLEGKGLHARHPFYRRRFGKGAWALMVQALLCLLKPILG